MTWRPLGPRIAAAAGAGTLVAILAVLWLTFDDYTRSLITPFQRGTVIAVLVAFLACLHAMGRARITATDSGLTVVNGYRRREYEWAQVVAIQLPRGAPWATLDLADGNTAAAMGIQGSDGARARAAVREVRELLDGPHSPRD